MSFFTPLSLVACATCCLLAAAPAVAAAPPEVEKTTTAFLGKWTAEATLTVGDAAPEKFPVALDCRSIAKGAGTSCDMSGTSSLGPWEATCLVGFDPVGSTGVHFMCVTTDGEVHDHRGRWTDATHLKFERLSWSGGPGGPGWEDLSCAWPTPRTMTWSSVMGMPDGTRVTFELEARK